jgi:hypothetical protein
MTEGFNPKIETPKGVENYSHTDIETRIKNIDQELENTTNETEIKKLKDEKFALVEKLITHTGAITTPESMELDTELMETLEGVNSHQARDNVPGLEM